MNADVVIVGAGPAGIFTALELLRRGSPEKIVMIEQGQAIENRRCPKAKTGRCMNCKPYCHITTGFSGAGAFSDGKLSLCSDVGGDLPTLVGERQAQEIINYADSIYLEFGADAHVEGLENTEEVKRIRFFMTFGQSYLTHMKCLENVGMLSTTPVEFNGQQIVPIQFLKTLLPDPASLGPRTVGKTNIGCIITGVKDGKEKTIYIYNVCDHQECYKELGCQAVAYTTGVPAMIGAAMVLSGQWSKKGVYTTDEFDPDPYMQMLNEYGLPWVVEENPETVA
jgi:hypothetical protein